MRGGLLGFLCTFVFAFSLLTSPAQAQVQLFPPSNPADCAGGGILSWDGQNSVKCIHIPTSCASGQVAVFHNGSIDCETVVSNLCPAGYVLSFGAMSADGVFNCCPSTGTGACTHVDLSHHYQNPTASSCIPSGLPNGQSNDMQVSSPAALSTTSCGQLNGFSHNCCSGEASWQNYSPSIDPWGTLTRHGHPLDGTWYECLCH